MEASKPLVVTKATRPHLRCKSALVPTVVPCSRITGCLPAICVMASAMAFEGSEGVEKSLSALNAPVAGSSQTQSVNVPPVSMAIRNGGEDDLPGMMSAPREYIGGDEDKEEDRDHAIHGEERGVQTA